MALSPVSFASVLRADANHKIPLVVALGAALGVMPAYRRGPLFIS